MTGCTNAYCVGVYISPQAAKFKIQLDYIFIVNH